MTVKFGDDSPLKRNVLIMGGRGSGKTHLIQKWLSEKASSRRPLVFHKKEREWDRFNIETRLIGTLNKRSYVEQLAKGRVVIIDDALNLTANLANKVIAMASVNRYLQTNFVVSSQGLGEMREKKDDLHGTFNVYVFFPGSASCATLVKQTNRYSKEVTFIQNEIGKLQPHEVLIYDKDTNRCLKTDNDNSELLESLIDKPLEAGQELRFDLPAEGSSKHLDIVSRKEQIRLLIGAGKSPREILQKVGTSAGYLTKVRSELRLEGYDIPKLKPGRPCDGSLSEGFHSTIKYNTKLLEPSMAII